MGELTDVKADIREIKDELKAINRILNGNGRAGLVAIVTNLDQIRMDGKKFRYDLFTLCFRAFVTILLSYIALKLGLKTVG